MNFYTKYYTSLLGSELRQVDFQPAMKLLKEYAVSMISQRNDALFIVQTLENLEVRTELQEKQLKAMRMVHEIEERRCESLSQGIRKLEEFAKIPPPIWPLLRKGR